MNWPELRDREIEKVLREQDVSEVIASAVESMITGSIDHYMISVGGPVNCSTDPKQEIDYGQRLLCAAIDKLKEECRGA